MILSTTPTIEGHPIREYRGVVTGETIIGTNFVKDFFASVRDVIGGRSGSYESTLREAKDTALREMADRAASLGCNAIVGIDLDYETVGNSGSMLMVTCSGTAVIILSSATVQKNKICMKWGGNYLRNRVTAPVQAYFYLYCVVTYT